MYFDNLTIAGTLAVSLYALLPLLFGKEFLRVHEDDESVALATPAASEPVGPGCEGQPQPCGR